MVWPPPLPTAEELYNIARGALPRFLFQKAGIREVLWGYAKEWERVARFTLERYLQTIIKQSTGIWVDQHLADRGLYRQGNEPDPVARERARHIDDAATPAALLAIAQAIMDAAGLSSPPVALVELRAARIHCQPAGKSTGFVSSKRIWRTGGEHPSLAILILPYGTTADTLAAMNDAIRKHRAAGYPHRFEVRRIP